MSKELKLTLPEAIYSYLMKTGEAEDHVVSLVTQDMLMSNARNFMGIDEPRRRRRNQAVVAGGGEEE